MSIMNNINPPRATTLAATGFVAFQGAIETKAAITKNGMGTVKTFNGAKEVALPLIKMIGGAYAFWQHVPAKK